MCDRSLVRACTWLLSESGGPDSVAIHVQVTLTKGVLSLSNKSSEKIFALAWNKTPFVQYAKSITEYGPSGDILNQIRQGGWH